MKYNLTDMHVHSDFSWDAQQSVEEIAEAGKQNGYVHIGVSDHIDFPKEHRQPYDVFEYEKRLKKAVELKEKYPFMHFGFEVGEPHVYPELYEKFIKDKDIDHVIGAVHMIDGETPVYEHYFRCYDSYEDAYKRYFEEIYKLVSYGNFDIAAHLDIVHRRGAQFYPEYTYEKFKDLIDDILKVMIDKKIALEINASGLRYFAKDVLPNADIIKAYIDMGGDMLTAGCDSHVTKDLFFGIVRIYEILAGLGVKEITVFEKRKPVKISIIK